MPNSSHQRITNSLPSTGRTNSAVQSSNLQSLTKGAASFLAARKLSSRSNSNADHSNSSITDMNSKASEKVASGSNSSEVFLDDLPCDFNDFSDDSEDDGMCTNSGNIQMSLPDRDNAAHASSVNHEEMETCNIGTSSVGKDDRTTPKESSFFNKLCEGMRVKPVIVL